MSPFRERLLKNLHQYNPWDEQEQASKNAVIQFISQYEDCFERTLTVGHITGSAWVVDPSGERVLLLHHKKLNIWVQPGGHCDGNGDVLAVAIKEAQEESGIQHIEPINDEIFDIDVHAIHATIKEPQHYHYDIRFLLRVTSNERPVKNDESHDIAWFAVDGKEFPTSMRSITRMLEKWHAVKQKYYSA